MALAIYFIVRGEDRWRVRLNHRDFAHNSLASALIAAIKAARTSCEDGHEAQVLVQRPDNSWAVTWTSEEDFEPNVPLPCNSGW
jgi:hypothetical protein